MEIVKVPIGQVKPWDKNPRGIKTKDFERLKKQILELGVYKPLVAYPDGDNFVVLGGNMRIRALKDLGIPEVDVSVVHPKDEAEKIKIALSDNDRAGFYEQDKLAELVYPHVQDLNLGDFKLDLGEPIDLKGFIDRYAPSDPDADRSSRDEEETYHFDIVFETKELCEEFLLLIKQIKQKFPDVTIGRAVAELLTEVMK